MNGVLNSAALLLVLAAVLAGSGQVLFKRGAGRSSSSLIALIDPIIAAGLCSAVGLVPRIVVAPSLKTLSVVYPFAAPTFGLVCNAAIYVFHATLTATAVVGSALVRVGLTALLWPLPGQR